MKKIISFILSLFLIITTGSAKADENDMFNTNLRAHIKKSIYTEFVRSDDLDFVVRDGILFVDGEK